MHINAMQMTIWNSFYCYCHYCCYCYVVIDSTLAIQLLLLQYFNKTVKFASLNLLFLKLAYAMQKLKKYFKKFLSWSTKIWGGGHIAHGCPPPLRKTLENRVRKKSACYRFFEKGQFAGVCIEKKIDHHYWENGTRNICYQTVIRWKLTMNAVQKIKTLFWVNIFIEQLAKLLRFWKNSGLSCI